MYVTFMSRFVFLQGSITYTFPCNRWLARDEDNGAIERELVAEKAVQEVMKNGEVQTKEVKLRDKLESMWKYI